MPLNYCFCPKCGFISRTDEKICCICKVPLIDTGIEDDLSILPDSKEEVELRQKIWNEQIVPMGQLEKFKWRAVYFDMVPANPLTSEEIMQQLEEERKREEENVPKCPTCGSTNIHKLSNLERGASIGFFGIFSKEINKTFKCNNCGYTW